MKIININPGYFYGVINEANVLNIQPQFAYGREPDPTSGESRESWSIEGYIEKFLDLLGSEDTKRMFAKKVRKLLMNDERFLNHVRKFERGMPEWAEKAIKQKQLMYFEPTSELNQALTHIAHYLGALEKDMKSPDSNISSHATKEYAAFSRAENLELIYKKTNEYFKRGSKKASRSEEGMKQLADYEGWKWYQLIDAEAFVREGKTLQNCIGKEMTPAYLAKEKLLLIVLRKPTGETVVAMSIKKTNNEIQELKGKNETTPKAEYMRYVLEFINDPKFKKTFGGFTIARDAERNFRDAGYFWIDNLLLTRAQVVAKYIKANIVATFPDNNKLVEIKVASQNKKVLDIFEDVYDKLKTSQYKSGGKEYASVYELRNDRDLPLVTGAVFNKKLESIQRHTTLRESTSSLLEAVNQLKGRAVKEFVGELMRRGIINSINEKMERSLFWNERVQLNKKTGKFDPFKPESSIEHQHTKKKKVTWEKHTNDELVKMLRKTLEGHTGNVANSERWSDIFGTDKKPNPVSVYITTNTLVDTESQTHEEEGKHFAMIKRQDGVLIPIMIHSGKDRLTTSDTANANDEYKRRTFIRAAAALANKEKLKLNKSFAYNNGIVREKGEYEEFDWKKRTEKLQDDPEILKIDLNGIPPGDRMNAINFVLVTGAVRHRNEDEIAKHPSKRSSDEENLMWRHDLELQLKLDYLIDTGGSLKGYERGKSIWSQPSQEETNDWEGHNPDEFLSKIYHGKEPTAIYLVMVEYGKGKKHQVLMIADSKTILEIDAVTERYGFQNWGDHERVAQQLNEFAQKQGLTFDQEALGDIGEMEIYKGQVMTEPMKKRAALKKTPELTKGEAVPQVSTGKTVNFKDGTELVETKAKGGNGWAIIDEDKFIGFITVSNGTVTNVSGAGYDYVSGAADNADQLTKEINPDLVNYATAAITHFGWKVKAIPQFIIKVSSPAAKTIAKASEHGEIKDTNSVKSLVNLGLIKTRDVTSRARKGDIKVTLTPLGKQAHKKLEKSTNVNVLKLKSRMKVV